MLELFSLHTFRVLMTYCLYLFCALPAAADTGIGFAWDQSAGQENMYNVNLSSGLSTAIGILPGLKTVVVGSHNVDYQTGVTLMLGSAGGENADTLFAAVSASQLAWSFKIAEAEGVLLQRALIRSSDGVVFLLGTDRTAHTSGIYKAVFDSQNGKVTMGERIADLGQIAFSLDGVRLGDDNALYIMLAGEVSDSLMKVDLGSGLTETVPLPGGGHTALFLCNRAAGTVGLYGFLTTRTPQVGTSLVEIAADGSETTVHAGIQLSMLSGSAGCSGDVLRFIGEAAGEGGSGSRGYIPVASSLQLNTLDLSNPAASFQATPLQQGNLKYVGVTKARIVSQSNQVIRANSARRFYLFAPKAIKKCAAQLGRKNPLPKSKKASFRTVAKALSKIRRKAGRCLV